MLCASFANCINVLFPFSEKCGGGTHVVDSKGKEQLVLHREEMDDMTCADERRDVVYYRKWDG